MKTSFYMSLIGICATVLFLGSGLLRTSIQMNQEDIIAQARADAITDFLAEQPIKVLTNIRIDSIPTREL